MCLSLTVQCVKETTSCDQRVAHIAMDTHKCESCINFDRLSITHVRLRGINANLNSGEQNVFRLVS